MSTATVPTSSQIGLHPRLDDVVRKHLCSVWQQPVRDHSRQAFDQVRLRLESASRLVLDSGCGTGLSTARLARLHDDALVLGIDKSAARLARAPELPDNALVVRAELADFWRLMALAGLRTSKHYLLYPNPWPKPGHLARRWHAHPVFPDLVGLGGELELRANFAIYVQEFARALRLAGIEAVKVVSFRSQTAISPFEAKYLAAGHVIDRLTANLEDSS